MAVLTIRGHEVDADITSELEVYDWGYNARWTADKLISASPFRHDNTPSFFVRLDGEYAGAWADSGAVDDEYQSGHFTKLLAYLRSESIEETERYLLEQYGRLYTDANDIRLPELRTKRRVKYRQLAPDNVTQAISPYLTTRGISADTQRRYGVGYNADLPGYTAIPWYTPDGRLANVKYRSTRGKTFFYEKGAQPIRQLVYGLHVVNSDRADTAVLVEGEIDAMSWRTASIPAIAFGGSSISREQIDAIKRSSIRRLLVGGDNDPAGQRLNAEVKRLLSGKIELFDVDYGAQNDSNDYLKAHGVAGLERLANFTVSKLSENGIQLRKNIVI